MITRGEKVKEPFTRIGLYVVGFYIAIVDIIN
jgi:hypothetical protein